MERPDDFIDVEVLSETTAEVEKPQQPKKITSDHSRSIEFWNKLSQSFWRFGSSFFFLFAIAGLTFSILYSQSNFMVHFVFMIICWSMTGLSVVSVILGLLFRRITISLMKKDPNYEKYVS